MIVAMLSATAASGIGSQFVGEWRCASAFEAEPLNLDLSVRLVGEDIKADISASTDARLPNGPIEPLGPAWTFRKNFDWEKRSEIMADVDQHFSIKNDVGDMNFQMLWDEQDGVSVNLRQYFEDRSPSKYAGALKCSEKPK